MDIYCSFTSNPKQHISKTICRIHKSFHSISRLVAVFDFRYSEKSNLSRSTWLCTITWWTILSSAGISCWCCLDSCYWDYILYTGTVHPETFNQKISNIFYFVRDIKNHNLMELNNSFWWIEISLFPFELSWFLVGAISFRYKEYLISLFSWVKKEHESILSYSLVSFLCIASISFTTDPQLSLITRLFYPTLFAIVIPFIFHATARIQFDRFIGELSYPFYIFHQSTVLSITSILFPRMFNSVFEPDTGIKIPGLVHIYALIAIICAFIIALLAHRFEKRWVEPIRQKLSQPIRISKTAYLTSATKKN